MTDQTFKMNGLLFQALFFSLGVQGLVVCGGIWDYQTLNKIEFAP